MKSLLHTLWKKCIVQKNILIHIISQFVSEINFILMRHVINRNGPTDELNIWSKSHFIGLSTETLLDDKAKDEKLILSKMHTFRLKCVHFNEMRDRKTLIWYDNSLVSIFSNQHFEISVSVM